MRIVLRALKVNIMSLIALPCLILAFASKLLTKLFEKLETVMTMALFTGLVAGGLWLYESIKNSTDIWLNILKLGGTASGLFIIVFIIRSAFSIIKSAFAIVKNAMVLVFDTLYSLVYSVFLDYYKSCKRDYDRITLEVGGAIAFVMCFVFDVLSLTDFLIIAFINVALLVFVILSVAIPLLFLYRSDLYFLKTEGIGLMAHLSLMPAYDRLKVIVMFAVFTMDLFVILVSIGVAWKTWANELDYDTDDEEKYKEIIGDTQEDFGKNVEYLEQDDERGQHYYDLLSAHVDDVDAFMEEIRGALDVEENSLLEDASNRYFKSLSKIMNVFADANGELTSEEFSELIPDIKRLNKRKNKIEKLIDKQNELLERPDLTSMFFSGCDTPEKLDKRYKSLCKTYHPDSESGDEDTFIAIKEEYERLKG